MSLYYRGVEEACGRRCSLGGQLARCRLRFGPGLAVMVRRSGSEA